MVDWASCGIRVFTYYFFSMFHFDRSKRAVGLYVVYIVHWAVSLVKTYKLRDSQTGLLVARQKNYKTL